MLRNDRPARFYLPPEARQDVERLHALAQRTPPGSEARRLVTVTMNALLGIKNGARGTHPLTYMPSYPDLSDCETTYVGADPVNRPSHRVVWRETLPEAPRGTPLREVVAIGERANGAAYHIAGQRLGRPIGVTLAELAAQPEPIAGSRLPLRQRWTDLSASSESRADVQYE